MSDSFIIIDLPQIAVIGKEGLCTKEKNIAADLWQQANSHFGEVASIGMKEADGAYVGFWGLMSDETMSFRPWTEDFSRGMYLAGIEVYSDTPVPEGWTKWIMPARKYLVADVTPDIYNGVFSDMIHKTIPAQNMRLSGAVCDYIEPRSGKSKLFFPVEEL